MFRITKPVYGTGSKNIKPKPSLFIIMGLILLFKSTWVFSMPQEMMSTDPIIDIENQDCGIPEPIVNTSFKNLNKVLDVIQKLSSREKFKLTKINRRNGEFTFEIMDDGEKKKVIIDI